MKINSEQLNFIKSLMGEEDMQFFSENLLPNYLHIINAVPIKIRNPSKLSTHFTVDFML